MRNTYLINTLLFLLLATFWTGCKSSKVTESKYNGEWPYTFEMEGTEYAAIMTINKVENGYSGALSSEMGSVDLDNLVIEEDKLKASYDIQGYVLDLEGTFEGETFKGLSNIDGYEFPMEAIRKK